MTEMFPTIREERLDMAAIIGEMVKLASLRDEATARYDLLIELSKQHHEAYMAEGAARQELVGRLLDNYSATRDRIFSARWPLRLLSLGGSAVLDMQRGMEAAHQEMRQIMADVVPVQTSSVDRELLGKIALVTAITAGSDGGSTSKALLQLAQSTLPPDLRATLQAMPGLTNEAVAKDAARS